MGKIRHFLTIVVLATCGTVLTAAQLDNLSKLQPKSRMPAIDAGNFPQASGLIDDPVHESGDLIIPCVPFEDEMGRIEWRYESSDITC